MVTVTALRNRDKMIDVPEQRSGATPLEFREDKATGQVVLRGYAATYEPYDCYGGPAYGGWVEQLRADAFNKTLKASPDVMLLLNHTGAPLARTKSGTMTLSCDKRGLLVEARLDPSDPDVQALLPKMRRGDLDEMSFAFRVKDQEWNDDYTHRNITEVSLQKGDVSVVNYGMNPNTRVALAEGTVGALAELSQAQMAELRRLDSGLIERAISNLTQVRKKENPMDVVAERACDPKDEEKKSAEVVVVETEDEDDEAGETEEKAADKPNPFAEDEPEPDDNPDEEDEEKLALARSLKATLDAAMKVASDDEVKQLLARAQGQLKVMRGISNGPNDIEKMLSELRSEQGDPGNTVTEGLEYLRQNGTAPVLWPESFKT